MLTLLWADDMSVVFTGDPAGDAVQFDSLGSQFGTGVPVAVAPSNNASAYMGHTFYELVRQVWRRIDLYLSDRLLVAEFPLLCAFGTSVGLEGLVPATVSLPSVPATVGRRAYLDAPNLRLSSHRTLEITAKSSEPITLVADLWCHDGSRPQLTVAVGTEWSVAKAELPEGAARVQRIGLGVDVIPTSNAVLEIGRVSFTLAPSLLPKPTFP